ncbi:UNKNOWN [Stylonychia lemnae]|uniref:BAR domain-containing protein n=1 Tax=Stylonychia lemnae TaxID=5949 RepID=A0A077ZN04_STYLE|nr:UNKNOWN [Stylonychia lemnae]|eukprot:CDW71342.1 UNKNOWN [Stylonychia lemnae]
MIEAHEMFGLTLNMIYENTPFQFYTQQVNMIVKDSSHIKNKLINMNKNFNRMCEVVSGLHRLLKGLEKDREKARVAFDHYRIKVKDLEKSHMKSSDPKKLDKFSRNRGKFDMAKQTFNSENAKLEQQIDQIRDKIDVILNQLIFKFSKDVEAEFYHQINLQFSKLKDMEEKMREISLKAVQGKFGNVGGQMELNMNF